MTKSMTMCVTIGVLGGYALQGQGREQAVVETQELRVVKDGRIHAAIKAVGEGAELVLFAYGEPLVRVVSGKETTIEVAGHGSEAKWTVACSGDLVEAGASALQVETMARLEKINGRWNAAMRCRGRDATVAQSCNDTEAVINVMGPHRATASVVCNEAGGPEFLLSSNGTITASAYGDHASVKAQLGKMGSGPGMEAKATVGREDKEWSWLPK